MCCDSFVDLENFKDVTDICNTCESIYDKLMNIKRAQIKNTNTYVYLITCPIFKKENRYKIGMHTGDINKLRNRYVTAFPDFIVERFWKITNPNAHEKALHHKCRIFRHNKSEWFKSVEIPKMFDEYVSDITQNPETEYHLFEKLHRVDGPAISRNQCKK